jgi:ribosome-associated translation inhibitor RaiA
MNFSKDAWQIFNQSIGDYHILDFIDTPIHNPFQKGTLEHLLYAKNWIDTVQWHLEDIIRDENIDPTEALKLKRRIDASNQQRTDLVEYVDSWFLQKYENVVPTNDAKINSETPAWAIDRLSILALKVYHMALEANRESASEEHRAKCQEKLNILQEQHKDLSTAIDQLLKDIENGVVKMKVYKQMKMYNDDSLNPILYQKGKK